MTAVLVRRVGESPDGETLILAVEGEVDLATAAVFRAELHGHARNALMTLVLDLSGLEFMDSSGIRVLFELASTLRDHGQHLRLVIPENAQPWRALQLSGVERVAEVTRTLQADQGEASSG